ncbi:PilZ domain-containing protein, partial [Arthrospira platensis SPKY1]|nr:PilZ domain-containing protein [Arthrospira platensis SPKY1]
VIRKATRVRTRLAAEVGPDADDPAMQPGTLLNISATGVLLHTRASVGDKGGTVRLRFGFKLHDVDSELTVAVDIRNVEREDDSNGEGADYHYGLDFRNLQPNDRLMIRSFVYQTIIE